MTTLLQQLLQPAMSDRDQGLGPVPYRQQRLALLLWQVLVASTPLLNAWGSGSNSGSGVGGKSAVVEGGGSGAYAAAQQQLKVQRERLGDLQKVLVSMVRAAAPADAG